jgi:hypothetical protein
MTTEASPTTDIGLVRQSVVWLLGLAAAVVGLLNLVSDWDADLAPVQLVLLLLAPVAWMIRPQKARPPRAWPPSLSRSWSLALFCGLVSLGMHVKVGAPQLGLDPAYQDEYSYLFQSRLFLSGHVTLPSSPVHPELFDQMHVLNEGRMASRYLPGNALWLTPFLALGHPIWGIWLAGVLSTILVFWTGKELGGARTGFLAGLFCGVSPAIALFGNLFLAHQATLLGLSFFLWAMVRLQARRLPLDALWAGIGLSWAMLCRPATAAGFGLPFGLWVGAFLLAPKLVIGEVASVRRRLGVLLGLGAPLLIGFAVAFAYNREVTGSGWESTYQVYTDIYTPRHVYGFNNVIRGEQTLGPKVIDDFDRWAKNLTPELALENVFIRTLMSWQWTFDIVLLVMTAAACCVVPLGWKWILAAIVSLHAVHIPYWFDGIFRWHYVYESSILWLLLLAAMTSRFAAVWRERHRPAMAWWWGTLLFVTWWGVSWGLPGLGSPRLERELSTILYPKQEQTEFREWVQAEVQERPALVLVIPGPDDLHVELVDNRPGLTDDLLWGRFQPGRTDLEAIVRDFPDRAVYVCRFDRSQFVQLSRPRSIVSSSDAS